MRGAPWLLALALVGGAASAAADDKAACVKASDEAQVLRDEGKLRAARERLVACAANQCPGVVKKACADWLAKVEASMPSIVLGLEDEEGHDIRAAHVSLDGAPLVDSLDGKAVAVDPGPHKLRFEAAGHAAIDLDIVVREGEKARTIVAHIPASKSAPLPPPPSASPSAPPAAPLPTAAQERAPIPTGAFVTGAIGLAAFGSFAAFGILGKNQLSNLHSTCGLTRSCTQSDVDAARTKLIVADISLGVGAAAVIATAVLVLTRGTRSPRAAFVPTSHGGFGVVTGSF